MMLHRATVVVVVVLLQACRLIPCSVAFAPSTEAGTRRYPLLPNAEGRPDGARRTALFFSSSTPSWSASAEVEGDGESKSATVDVFDMPDGKTRITLVGTAHLSKASNDEVRHVVQQTRPDVVMIELDPSRLTRIGYEGVGDIGLPVVTAEELGVPMEPSLDENGDEDAGWFRAILPQNVIKNLLLDAFSSIARKFLTGMYDEMSVAVRSEDGPGGEFVAAIESAKSVGTVKRILLGDRMSVQTIRRAAQLVLNDPSTSPGDALTALQRANQEEIDKLEVRLREKRTDLDSADSGAWSQALIEEIKADSEFRQRLFDRLEVDVPHFTEAFLRERDVIMAGAISKQAEEDDVRSIVGVVGLAHVPGIRANLLKEQQP